MTATPLLACWNIATISLALRDPRTDPAAVEWEDQLNERAKQIHDAGFPAYLRWRGVENNLKWVATALRCGQ